MAVTDQQLAALRARLSGDLAEHKRLLGQLDWITGGTAYALLIDAAFCKAVNGKFGPGTTGDDVVRYVADVRGRLDAAAEAIDPQAAERLIGKVLGQGSIEDLDPKTAYATRQFVLAAIIADGQLPAAQLDSFLDDARKLADEWLARL